MAYLIAVCGGSGSGKTFVAEAIQKRYGERCSVLSYDNYYRDQSHLPMEERAKLNYDDPDILDSELYIEHLHLAREGKSIDVPQYDFATHTRKKETIRYQPTDIVICEGIMVMQLPLELYDATIFVSADSDLRLSRRIFRDLKERGRTVESIIDQYFATVKPMHRKYVSPMKKKADFVLDNNLTNGSDEYRQGLVFDFLDTVIH